MTQEQKDVPRIQIEDNKVVEQTKDIPLIVNDKEEIVTVRKLSTGVRNKIRSSATKTVILGGQPNITVNDAEIQEQILAKAIVKAPFAFDIESIKKLPAEVSDYLFIEYQEFAEPDIKKKD